MNCRVDKTHEGMAETKSKTRSGKEFKEENENEDLEKFATVTKEKTVQRKVN